jgi:signal transduction histidine kinase/CheY-like chemotaxis protein
MVLVSYLFVSSIVKEQIFKHAQEMIRAAETTIRMDFRDTEVPLITISQFIDDRLKSGWTEKELKDYLVWTNRVLASQETDIPGFFNLFCFINGKFISGRNDWIPPDDYDPPSRSWYIAAKKAGAGVGYSSRYRDRITGEEVVSLTRLMETGGESWAVGIDLHLEPFFGFVSGLQSAIGGYGLLMDQDFSLLFHPNTQYLGRQMGVLSPYHADFVRNLRQSSGAVVVQQLPNWRGVMMVLVSKRLFNGWYLAIASPVASYYKDVNFMAIVLSCLGFSFMTILGTFLIRLSLQKARSDEESLEKTSFLAKMSHEIRTPMNSILGMAELIQRKNVSSEIQEYISILYQSGQSLLAIINDILDFSRIESNRLQIERREYQIASVINDLINVIRPRVSEKSLDFFVYMDSAIPSQLTGDDGRLRQILMNLLSNAVKYTRKGSISLEVRMEKVPLELVEEAIPHAVKLVFSVVDTGIGIKPEDVGRLFADFSRLDAELNQGIEGTGLGLVITRALCRAMGGDVTVSSEYGRGSVFQASIIQEAADETPSAQIANPEARRVLFFDWRPQYIAAVTRAFKNLGLNIECPPDFSEFLKALEFGNYGHAFISSKYAMDCIYILGKRATPVQLVIMVELGEVSVFREVGSIMMPVYSVTLANALNDHLNEDVISHTAKLKIRFIAPSAKILIVDDISTNLRVAKELMNPYNMNIHTSLSGIEALELVRQNRYDIVFMDHMMPGMDGLEATTCIRSMESDDGYYTRLPIIALTANAVTGQRELFLQSGINDFLAKPIDIQKLNDILEKWLPAEKRIEKSRAEDESGTEKTEILIAGVDTEAGLYNMGGAFDVYLDILMEFCRDADTRIGKINDALHEGDIELYVTLVHALKGASRSIGAMEVGEAAFWLEKEAGNLAPPLLQQKTAELLENVRILTDNIKNAVARHTAEDSRKLSDVAALNLDALKTALAGMDMEAVNKLLLEYAGLSLDSETKSKIAEVEQHILMFEYDKAIEKIDKLF